MLMQKAKKNNLTRKCKKKELKKDKNNKEKI